MEEKVKILLGSKDIVSKQNVDLFLEVNLERTFSEFKKQKYDNNFDLAEQFKRERNSSRNFCIYGIIDSTVVDSDNLNINLFSDSGLTNLITATTSSTLAYNQVNVFSKKRGKYFFELKDYAFSDAFISIPTNNINYNTQIYEQKLVFSGVNGNFINYGTQTIDIGLNGEVVQINNDFPFLFNRHYIKNDLNITEIKEASVSFLVSGITISEGQQTQLIISLDKPSPFGNETVDFDFNSLVSTASLDDFTLLLSGNVITFPNTLTWSIGEKQKVFDFSANADFNIELKENVNFILSNFQSVKQGNFLTNSINILDSTPRNFTTFNFGPVFNNRVFFTGRTVTTYVGTTPYEFNPTSSPTVLRNGFFFEKRNEEFYPNDTFNLRLINTGIRTLIPSNSGLGNVNDEIINTGEFRDFNITSIYSSTTKHSIQLKFASAYTPFDSSRNLTVYINGFKVTTTDNHVFTNISGLSWGFNEFIKRINGSVDDVYIKNSIEKPFTFISDLTGLTITFTSSNSGVPLDISLPIDDNGSISRNIPSPGGPIVITHQEIVPFNPSNQIPKEITLLANSNNNTTCSYDFRITKPGYIILTGSTKNTLALAPVPNKVFLVTAYNNIEQEYDSIHNSCIFFSSSTAIITDTTNAYLSPLIMPVNDAYVNGFLLMSLPDPSRPSFDQVGTRVSNLTQYGNTAGDFRFEFLPQPISTLPCTGEEFSPLSVAQRSILTINALPISNNSYRSFDVIDGVSPNPVTFISNINNYAILWFDFTAGIYFSSSTQPKTFTTGLKYNLDTGGGFGSLPVGNIHAASPGIALSFYPIYSSFNGTLPNPALPAGTTSSQQTINLIAKTPGIPFDINNIIDSQNTISFITLEPNQTKGVTKNPTNNFMGGFVVVRP